MATHDRKPFTRMETLEARTLRGPAGMWGTLDRMARERGKESAEFGRDCILMGLMLAMNPHLMEASVGVLASIHIAEVETLERSAGAAR